MKLIILGDLQLVSPEEPMEELRIKRRHFADAWPSFQDIVTKVRAEAPDLVVCVGDLVDWYSETNRDFAVELMGQLNVRWEATPGNHDFSMYEWNEEKQNYDDWKNGERWLEADKGWKEAGVNLDNRVIDTGATRLILMNSAFSDILPGTREWLAEAVDSDRANILITHVPIDIPPVRDYIASIDPRRKIGDYLHSHVPELYEESIKGKVRDVYTGHLHLPGAVTVEGTHMHLLSLSIVSQIKYYPGMGTMEIIHVK
ncbi:MAG: Calcineurin-like phosphoesterase [Paenibacillaceae bacterium]|nr:Calcineurin-like phosphoesterase [Paenibacillaceae bacterium]